MLHISRIVFDHVGNASCQFLRNGFAGLREPFANEFNPIGTTDSLQGKNVPETVERVTLALEKCLHQSFSTAVQTVRNVRLYLPGTAQESLEFQRIFEFADLLEFVNANHYSDIFSLSNFFRQLKNFVRLGANISQLKRNRKIIDRIRSKRDLGNESGQEAPGQLHPLFPFD